MKTELQAAEITSVHNKNDAEKLLAYTKEITTLYHIMQTATKEIAVALNAINVKKLYEINGYSDIIEWAKSELGLTECFIKNSLLIASLDDKQEDTN